METVCNNCNDDYDNYWINDSEFNEVRNGNEGKNNYSYGDWVLLLIIRMAVSNAKVLITVLTKIA